jgi:hypothetical protein
MDKNFKFHSCNCDKETIPLEERLKCLSADRHERWITEKAIVIDELRNRYALAYPNAAADPVLHSEQCVSFVARILNKDHSLSPHELFILLYSLYIHDIGMVSQKQPFVPILKKGEHYKIVEAIIHQESWVNLTEDERFAVGYLCRWHNRIEFFSSAQRQLKNSEDRGVVRIELLLKIVHLCDDYHRLVDFWEV